MHRSGSSATMGILRILGVDIGDDLGGRNAFNPKGYLENQEFYHFEQKVLKAARANWQTIVPEGQIYKAFQFYKKEYDLLVKTYDRSPMWGYKAIRGGLFPEILLRIPNLHIVISFRGPKAVVGSLRRRNKFPPQKSLWLWSTYYNRIFRFLSRHPEIPYTIVNYDDLVERTVETVKRLAKFLDVEMNRKMRKASEDWMEEAYRHFKGDSK